MPEPTETLIDSLFLEPYGLDDCMEIMKIFYNKSFDLKSINYKDAKEKIAQRKTFDINISANGTYMGHHRLYSEKSIDVLNALSVNPENAKYLENRIVNFFNSFEWEKWTVYAEELSGPAPQKAKKKSISATK